MIIKFPFYITTEDKHKHFKTKQNFEQTSKRKNYNNFKNETKNQQKRSLKKHHSIDINTIGKDEIESRTSQKSCWHRREI